MDTTWMWTNPEIQIQILDHFWLRQKNLRRQVHLALVEVCVLRVLSDTVNTTKTECN